MHLRQMKTAMDVKIRQKKGPSSQNPDLQLRQVSSMRIRGSFALREEVIAELPDRYRKALLSMPRRQRELILSEIERKIDRKIQSGAMAKTAARLDTKGQTGIQKMTANGSRRVTERKQAAAQRYRLKGTTGKRRNGKMYVFAESPLSDELSDTETWNLGGSRQPIGDKTRREQIKRRSQGLKAGGRIPPDQDPFTISPDQGSEIEAESRTASPDNKNQNRAIESIRKEAAKRQAEVKSRAGPSVHTDIGERDRERSRYSNAASGTDGVHSLPEDVSYQQLLAGARTKKEQTEIRKAFREASAGRRDQENSRILQNAALRSAYLERGSSQAYGQILKDAGFSSGGEKAATQLAYEKQVRKVLKGEYRKQLMGKLSRLKTSSLAKKVQMQKYRQEQMQEDEQNLAMTEEARQAFSLMSKGTRVLKKLADDASKAIRAMIRKNLVILVIPLLMALVLPFLMMAIPILGTATATSYEDNEVYAYADAAELIEYAKQWIGKIPYVWGGGHGGSPTAWQSGCDCSGFVHGVFNHFGYEIGGDTGAMETQAGTHIAYDSLAQAKPGDVLIYYRTGAHVKGQPNGAGSTHVSIYIGNNQIIHQSGGVHISNEYHQYFEVRRVLTPDVGGRGNISGGLGGMGTYGHRTDATNYSQSDLELIWAIVAQEDNGSYKGALAVISSAMNRVESPTWSYEGSNALAQLTAPGQYCYSNDTYWQARLGGNVPDYVKQAVNDCLKKGKRNHNYTSFRSTKGKTTGPDAVQIGGNWFFGH